MEASELLKYNFSKGGIYCIRNKNNNKLYIGSAINFKKRYIDHLSKLNTNVHKNLHLLSSYKKNKSFFEMDVLEIVSDFSNIRIIEQNYIIKYNVCDKNIGYNLTENTKCCSKDKKVRQKISDSTKNNMLKEIEKTGIWKLTKYQFKKGVTPKNKGLKMSNTINFHNKKTITQSVLDARKKSSLKRRENGEAIVCLNKKKEELFVFRSLADMEEMINKKDYGFTICLSRLCKAIKNEKLYKKHYFIKRVPNKSDFIRKSDELLETLM